jgi:glutathione S-transferase
VRRLLPDLFHVAETARWCVTAPYLDSTRGLSLADVGFVHLAFAWQVPGVLARFYRDAEGPLTLLRLEPSLLQADVRVEPAAGAAEAFPHLYGPLDRAAVVEEVVLAREEGGWCVPGWLAGPTYRG